MKDFIVLDLETPNGKCDSISSIGIIVVKDNRKVDEIYSLINPEDEFDDFNIMLTGIHPEDVVDAPTFQDYWSEIDDIVTGNIIVGQNITFDLGVISKSLARYDMGIPSFKYYCTLRAAKRNIVCESYKLEYMVTHILKKNYDAHNALADAQVTFDLYNYLGDYEKNRSNHLKYYSYRSSRAKRDFDRSMDLDLNYLYGLIQKFKYSQVVSDNHFQLLVNWFENNNLDLNHDLLKYLHLKLQYIIEKGDINPNDAKCLLTNFMLIKRSPEYKPAILLLSALQGIIDSILCYDKLEKEDIVFLDKWTIANYINDKCMKEFYKQLEKAIDNGDYEEFRSYLLDFSIYLSDYLNEYR